MAGDEKSLQIPLGDRAVVTVTFTPPAAGPLQLELTARKGGQAVFADKRPFVVE